MIVFKALILLFAVTMVPSRQYFAKVPKNISVGVSENIILPCKVAKQVGQVQWSKQGLMLGYQQSIPGWPRYSMKTNVTNGDFNLFIKNSTTSDEGLFECQVGPAKNNPPLRSAMYLTVTAQRNVTRNTSTQSEKNPLDDGKHKVLAIENEVSDANENISKTRNGEIVMDHTTNESNDVINYAIITLLIIAGILDLILIAYFLKVLYKTQPKEPTLIQYQHTTI